MPTKIHSRKFCYRDNRSKILDHSHSLIAEYHNGGKLSAEITEEQMEAQLIRVQGSHSVIDNH
jgi:hypothetical protein